MTSQTQTQTVHGSQLLGARVRIFEGGGSMSPVSRVSKSLVTAGDSPLADWRRRSSFDERYSRIS